MERHKHELYNTQTERVEDTQLMTSQEATERNEQLYYNDEPRRWMAVSKPKKRGNLGIAQRPEMPIEPDGNIIYMPTKRTKP